MNGQVEVTRQKFRNIAQSIMVYAQVFEEYTHIALIYTTANIFPVLPIKNLVNHNDEPTTPHKMTTGTTP